MLFFKKKKKEEKQDSEQKYIGPDPVFIIHLLMEDKCVIPEKESMVKIMEKHLGDVQCNKFENNMTGFLALNYTTHFKDAEDAPPQLMITECQKIEKPLLDDVSRSQLWDCEDSEQILNICKYQVIANDMMAVGMYYKDRADMLVNYVEALVEMFPSCKAVLFENSKKMMTREEILNNSYPKETKFIYYAVHARYFKNQDSDDYLVDTLGMSTFFMPDLQYYFHGMNPNNAIQSAYSLLCYMFENENPIKSGDTVNGTVDGEINPDVKWKVYYTDAMMKPERAVIDVNTGEFASGKR